MIMRREYLDEMKEHIESMKEEEFAKRGTTKEDVLGSQDTMERLWCVYQKDMEDYDCGKEFSLGDVIDKVLGPMPAAAPVTEKAEARYRCPSCGSERFIGHQVIRADVYVNGYGEYEDNLPGGLEANIYDSGTPYGPFTCAKCGREFDELPDNR